MFDVRAAARQVAERAPGAAGTELGMHRAREGPVERAREAPGEQRIQIVALLPVALATHLLFDARVVARPWQRIADGDADVVGHQLAHQRAGSGSISAQPSSGYPNCRKRPTLTPAARSRADRAAGLVDGDALVHRVEHHLRAGLAPSHTSLAPARRRAATFSSVIRSARVWQRNGVRSPAAETSSATRQ